MLHILIILIKFISISDLPLIIGQGLIALTFTTYFCTCYVLLLQIAMSSTAPAPWHQRRRHH